MLLDVKTNSVLLDVVNSRFENFSVIDYSGIYEKLYNGEIDVKNNAELESIENIELNLVDLQVIN